MISVIIPTYNRAHLIGETLDSIIAQTYPDWECIIIDDHSNDSTDDIINTYLVKDPRFSYYKKPKHLPKGPSASRNYGLTKANGDYINWFDSDDLMHPEKMQIDIKMITSGKYDFTISQSKFFKQDGAKPKKEYWNKNLWSDDPINDFIIKKIGWSTNAPLWNYKSISKINLSFHDILITGDDYYYHIQAINQGLRPIIINQDLVKQREHDNRLNDLNKKSPYKLIVFTQLIEQKSELNFSQEVENKLYIMIVRQFSNLLKNRNLTLAKKYRKELKLLLPIKYNAEINRLYNYGTLFYLTNRFYSKLKVNKPDNEFEIK
jgi:glycosyltransferase involved in cell wall biosynthesis